MKRLLSVLLLVLVLGAALVLPSGIRSAAAATSPASHAAATTKVHPAAFDKTRFIAHMAVAAFLVHYIYKKYKQGKLGRSHIFTDLKAAAAAFLAYHEIKKAYDIAKSSNSKTLQVLIAPISALTTGLSNAANKLKTGDTSGLNSLNSETNSLQSIASKTAYGFTDQQPAGFKGF